MYRSYFSGISLSSLSSLLGLMSLGVSALPLGSLASVHRNSSSSCPTIQWGPCSDSDPPGLQCGTLKAPLDHSRPYGDQITLGLARLKSNGSAPLGNLHINPGGPGGSGRDLVRDIAAGVPVLSEELMQNYNIIGLDPRGVGASTPVKCDSSIYNERVPMSATDNQTFAKLVAKNKALGESCVKMTGPVVYHLDTTQVVYDFDLVRAALGDNKFNFLGLSYGSQIGAQYVEAFPQNCGRLVIDGILDHSSQGVYMLFPEANTYEETLDQFFIWCREKQDMCAIGKNGTDPAKVWDDILAAADKSPIPAPGCVPSNSSEPAPCRSDVTAEEFIANAQGALVGVNMTGLFPGWAVFSEGLAETAAGNATAFSSQLTTPQNDYGLYAGIAIAAQDWTGVKSATDIKQLLAMATALGPHTRGITQSLAIQTSRPGWPAPVSNPPHVLDQRQVARAPKVLMLNAFHDPETSIVWAESVRRQLPGSPLVLRNGSGHTSYPLLGETSRVADRFFINGVLPVDGMIYDS